MTDYILQLFKDSMTVTYKNYKCFMDYINTYPQEDYIISEVERTLSLLEKENDFIKITVDGQQYGKLNSEELKALCVCVPYNNKNK